MPWSYRRRVRSGRRRLFAGIVVLVALVLILAGTGRLLGLGASEFWRLLGVRAAEQDEPPASAGDGDTGETGGTDGLTGGGLAGTAGQAGDSSAPGDGASSGPGDGGNGVGGDSLTESCLAPGASVVRVVYYEECQDEITSESAVCAEEVGLGPAELLARQAAEAGWELTTFSPERVELRRTAASAWCPLHTKRTLMLLDDGQLMLYAGDGENQPARLIELGAIAQITEAGLSLAEAELLRSGLVFASEDAVLKFIEGFSD